MMPFTMFQFRINFGTYEGFRHFVEALEWMIGPWQVLTYLSLFGTGMIILMKLPGSTADKFPNCFYTSRKHSAEYFFI
jgi:hypothetical protein